MKKIIKWVSILLIFMAIVTCADVYRDRQLLRKSLIRLHVVGASDSDQDQTVKLQVRDAVNDYLSGQMAGITTVEGAKQYLRENLDELEAVANEALRLAGSEDRASVSFMEEAFPARDYDTFSLPAGVYQSLRIRIGQARGRNWWCVVFPTFCLGAATEAFADRAVSAGFDRELTGALAGEEEYEIRFFLLDCLGMLENIFHRG